jgi:hypothetical protein
VRHQASEDINRTDIKWRQKLHTKESPNRRNEKNHRSTKYSRACTCLFYSSVENKTREQWAKNRSSSQSQTLSKEYRTSPRGSQPVLIWRRRSCDSTQGATVRKSSYSNHQDARHSTRLHLHRIGKKGHRGQWAAMAAFTLKKKTWRRRNSETAEAPQPHQNTCLFLALITDEASRTHSSTRLFLALITVQRKEDAFAIHGTLACTALSPWSLLWGSWRLRWPSCTHDLFTGTQILVFNPSTGST